MPFHNHLLTNSFWRRTTGAPADRTASSLAKPGIVHARCLFSMPDANLATKVHPVDVPPEDDAESGLLTSPAPTPGRKQATFARGIGIKSFHKAPVSGMQEDGTAEVHTLYLVALWLTLRAPFTWRTFSLFSFSIFLGLLQTAVALNLAW